MQICLLISGTFLSQVIKLLNYAQMLIKPRGRRVLILDCTFIYYARKLLIKFPY